MTSAVISQTAFPQTLVTNSRWRGSYWARLSEVRPGRLAGHTYWGEREHKERGRETCMERHGSTSGRHFFC